MKGKYANIVGMTNKVELDFYRFAEEIGLCNSDSVLDDVEELLNTMMTDVTKIYLGGIEVVNLGTHAYIDIKDTGTAVLIIESDKDRYISMEVIRNLVIEINREDNTITFYADTKEE